MKAWVIHSGLSPGRVSHELCLLHTGSGRLPQDTPAPPLGSLMSRGHALQEGTGMLELVLHSLPPSGPHPTLSLWTSRDICPKWHLSSLLSPGKTMFFWCGAVFFYPKPLLSIQCTLGFRFFQHFVAVCSLSVSLISFSFFTLCTHGSALLSIQSRHSNRLGGLAGKESIRNVGDPRFDPWFWRDPLED